MDLELLKVLIGGGAMGAVVAYVMLKVVLIVMPRQATYFAEESAKERASFQLLIKEEREVFRAEIKEERAHGSRQLTQVLDEHQAEASDAWARVTKIVDNMTETTVRMATAVAQCQQVQDERKPGATP